MVDRRWRRFGAIDEQSDLCCSTKQWHGVNYNERMAGQVVIIYRELMVDYDSRP
jgi:hypothetical protein